MSEIVLLDRFFRQIHVHLVNCFDSTPRWPIILGIFGRSGDGKSAQLTAAMARCRVEIIRLNAADLESGLAGEPGKHIARTYATASMAVAKGIPAAIIVDDVDTTVGEWELNTGTVNHQQVLAEIMHLADEPVDRARNFPRRVPIFVTGNNLARLYPPLRRHGRMNTFTWRPNPEETRVVIERIFTDVADAATLDLLADKFSGETLSFFAKVRQELDYDEASGRLIHIGHDMRDFLRRGEGGRTNGARRPVIRADLLQLAGRVQAEHRTALQDFLQDTSMAEGKD